jgi:hypothetical protein
LFQIGPAEPPRGRAAVEEFTSLGTAADAAVAAETTAACLRNVLRSTGLMGD